MDRRAKIRYLSHYSSPVKSRVALTAGDLSGAGLWAAKKALSALGPQKRFQFLLWAGQSQRLKISGFKTLVFSSAKSALNSPFEESCVLQIQSGGGPEGWLKEAGGLCLKKAAAALVTGPVSKGALRPRGARGQTELLKKLCKAKQAFMCFRGDFFNVLLWTDHIPLKAVSLKPRPFKNFLQLALKARSNLSPSLRKKPLGVLGLNPHAGEGGIIGKEERDILRPILREFPEALGPLAPDTAFLKKNWGLYSFFIALYHDQGLIPFKMAHSHKGFAQTLGLPFLRLGTGHGTGGGLKQKDISPISFLKALKEAVRLAKKT